MTDRCDPPFRGSVPVDDETREEIHDRVARAPGLVLCCDFDGTLAHIVEDPEAATVLPESRAALAALRDHPGVGVAVVSGRELGDVRSRVDVDDITYAGNHGLELEVDGERRVHPLAEAAMPLLDEVAATVERRLDAVDGAFVEHKTVSLTVHYRRAAVDASEVREAVEAAVAAVPDGTLRVESGKQIWEVRPDFAWDKGRVVDLVVREAGGSWLPMYVGDDTTDEDAFLAVREAGGIAVHVGHADTAADYRVPDPESVTRLLERLRDATGPRHSGEAVEN